MATIDLERKARLFAGVLFLFATLWCQGSLASECGIGLMSGSTPTIDGQEGAGEWTDASVLNSGSPCFQALMDYVKATDTYPLRNVTIKSKRYQRGSTWYLGFLLEVSDLTSEGPCGTKLCIGEKIIMQFNRVINGDAKLNVSQDKRFTLTHKWAGTGSDVTDGVIAVDPPVTDGSCTAVTGVDVQWGPSATNGIAHAIRKDVVGGGYRAEIEVPVEFISGAAGPLTNDIGVAMAVVNDFGKNTFGPPPDLSDCTVTGTCEGAGASFPLSLPETNDANPVDAICDKGWVVPKQWGVGYFRAPPGKVTISRLPVYWDSNGIQVFECNSATSSYTYYRAKPCKIRIRASLMNSGATARRKVVYLWAKHGTGDPTEYNFVDLKDVVVTAGAPATPSSTLVDSDLWAGMPKNQPNHPCLRVYIFPDSLSASHEDILRGTTTGGLVTKASLDSVVAANGIEDQHWAQKNISRHDTVTQCPDAECRVASLSPLHLDFSIKTAAAADTRVVAGPGATIGGTFVAPGGQGGMVLSGADWERYAKDHVIVRARTVAYRIPPSGHKPLYSFIEEFGGVVQLFPVYMVQENRELPLEFQVSNGSASTIRVKVITEVHVPPEVSGVMVNVADQYLTLQPQSVTTVKGTVVNTHAPPTKGSRWWLIILIILIILLVLILWYRRRSGP